MNNLIKKFISNYGVNKILNAFNKESIEIRFVGGCVRDAIIGINNYDFDFAINCEPNETISILKKNNVYFDDYAKRYGSVVAKINKERFEITSLREDLEQSGRDTKINFTSDWKKDSLRRDFTFNAMYLSCSGELFDYFNGQEDLANQQVRFIGNIEKKIKEDYLRIIRFYRFLGYFKNIKFIDDYEKILNDNISNIRSFISYEVIKKELLKMLNNSFAKNSLINHHYPNQKNELIINIEKWWEDDGYNTGLEKCINKINILLSNL